MNISVPYGLYVKRIVEAVHDYTFVRVLQDLCDNALDVKADPTFKVAHHNSHDYLITHTLGQNINDLENYFGLGNIVKKSGNKIGQHNCTALKSMCWLMPNRVIVLSSDNKGMPVSLTVQLANYVAAIEDCTSYSDDSISVSLFMTPNKGHDVFTELMPIFRCIRDRKMCKDISLIQEKEPFFAAIFEFDDRHRLYGKLDKSIEESLPSLGFTYYSALSYIKNIYVEYSTGKFTVFGRDNGLKDIFMRNARLDMRVSVSSNDVCVNLSSQVSVHGKKEGWTQWTLNDPTPPADKPFHSVGLFNIKFTYLTPQEVLEQGSTHDCRGVLLTWNGRRSSHAYWNTAWGPKENGTHMRCELLAEENKTIYKLLGHGDLRKAHPTIQKLISMIMVNLAFTPSEGQSKPVISSALYKVLQHDPAI